jgi:hypothetical protein
MAPPPLPVILAAKETVLLEIVSAIRKTKVPENGRVFSKRNLTLRALPRLKVISPRGRELGTIIGQVTRLTMQ